MIELVLSFGLLIATFAILVFLFEVFYVKYKERQEAEKNKDFDYDAFNKENFGI